MPRPARVGNLARSLREIAQPLTGLGAMEIKTWKGSSRCVRACCTLRARQGPDREARPTSAPRAPDHLADLRQHLVQGWTWGHFNRAVYENNFSSRVPRSHNLPKWWQQTTAADATTIMLDHGGKANWYVVLNPTDGEVDMMWVSR